jgi:hypothetical protein
MDPTDAPKPDTVTMPMVWIKTYTGDEGNTSHGDLIAESL